MKICPKCQKTYSDETLNFCLDDGSVLNQSSNTESDSLPAETVFINQPHQTSPNSEFGKTDYRNEELLMSSNKNNFYYVPVAPSNLKTVNVTTKVTVRNIENGENDLGYGLIIHSNPVPLQKDLAFLINAGTRSYRIVKHKPKTEVVVVKWTKSDSVKSDSQENILEVSDQNGAIKFFINGDFITSMPNADGFEGGVLGLYVGGSSPVGFSNLEIREWKFLENL